MKTLRILLCLCSFLVILPLHTEKAQNWWIANIGLWKHQEITFYLRQEYRFALSNYKFVDGRWSLCGKKAVRSWLDAEAHAMLISSRGVHETEFNNSYRFEFELNPHFELNKKTEIKFRNRLELTKPEDRAAWHEVFRQRHQLVWKVDKKYLKKISIHNELSYSFSEHRFAEYRFVPLELGFSTKEKHQWGVYTMLRGLHRESSWEKQLVLGINLEY